MPLAWEIDAKLHDLAVGIRVGRIPAWIGRVRRVEHDQRFVCEVRKIDDDVGALGGRQQQCPTASCSVIAQCDRLVEQAAIGADLPHYGSGTIRL